MIHKVWALDNTVYRKCQMAKKKLKRFSGFYIVHDKHKEILLFSKGIFSFKDKSRFMHSHLCLSISIKKLKSKKKKSQSKKIYKKKKTFDGFYIHDKHVSVILAQADCCQTLGIPACRTNAHVMRNLYMAFSQHVILPCNMLYPGKEVFGVILRLGRWEPRSRLGSHEADVLLFCLKGLCTFCTTQNTNLHRFTFNLHNLKIWW